MFNKAQLSKDHKDAKKPRTLAKPKDIDYVSKMGYRDDSPFNDRPYIDIKTPNGSIDMSNTGIDLMANGRFLPKYSGLHQFDTTTVRETPAAQMGGEQYVDLTDEEIAEYRRGGYVVEELPKAQNGATTGSVFQRPPNWNNIPESVITVYSHPELINNTTDVNKLLNSGIKLNDKGSLARLQRGFWGIDPTTGTMYTLPKEGLPEIPTLKNVEQNLPDNSNYILGPAPDKNTDPTLNHVITQSSRELVDPNDPYGTYTDVDKYYYEKKQQPTPQEFYMLNPHTGQVVYDWDPVAKKNVPRIAPAGSISNVPYSQGAAMASDTPEARAKEERQKADRAMSDLIKKNPDENAKWLEYKKQNPQAVFIEYRDKVVPTLQQPATTPEQLAAEQEIDVQRQGGYVSKQMVHFLTGGSLLTKKVTCKKCGWKWDAADGGDDVTTCHKCGGQGLVHAQKGGSQIYKYADRPEATYKKDAKGNWLISLPSTKGEYVPIKDPTGKRAGELNEKATLDPSQFRKQYDPLNDIQPQATESTVVKNTPKGDASVIDQTIRYNQAVTSAAIKHIQNSKDLSSDQKAAILSDPEQIKGYEIAITRPDAVKAYTPTEQYWGDRMKDLAYNPFTSLGYFVRGQEIPDNLQRRIDYGFEERNPLDFVTDVSPIGAVHSADNIYTKATDNIDGNFWTGNTALDALNILPTAKLIRSGAKGFRPNNYFNYPAIIPRIELNANRALDFGKQTKPIKVGVGLVDDELRVAEGTSDTKEKTLALLNQRGLLPLKPVQSYGTMVGNQMDWDNYIRHFYEVADPIYMNPVKNSHVAKGYYLPDFNAGLNRGGRSLRSDNGQTGLFNMPAENLSDFAPAKRWEIFDTPISKNKEGGSASKPANRWAVTDPRSLQVDNYFPKLQDGGNTDPGNNALELHMFYDKDVYKMQKGGTKPALGEEVYTYADRPEAQYKKDQSGAWHIMLPSTNNQFVPINDPSGQRSGELEEKAKVYVDPKKFARTYDPMMDMKPVPSETTQQVAGNLAHQVQASNPMSLNKFIENGVVLPSAPKITSDTPLWYPTDDIYYSPEEIEKQSTEYNRRMEECKKGDAQCFEQAQRYYDNYVAPKLNVPNYNEIKTNMGITSGDTHPNYDKYGKSADSWDIAALMAENEGKVFYKGDPNNPMSFQTQWGLGMGDPTYTEDQQNKYNDYWKSLNLPLGTIVNAGDAGGTGHYGTSSYNKEKGFVPSNHSSIVIGYSADGVPYLYDYGDIVSAADPGSLINRMGVTNIVAPKEVLNNTFGNVGTGEKLTPDVNTKLRFDTSKIQADPDEFKPFMNVLSSEKDMIRKALGVSDAEYNELARQSMATALAETGGGDDTTIRWKNGIPIPSYLKDKLGINLDLLHSASTGISQINPDVLFSGNDPQLARMLEAMGLDKESYDPWDPRDAAMATMAMVQANKKVAEANFKKTPTNDPNMSPAMMQYYQWNTPGTLREGEAWGENANVQRFMDIYNSLTPVDAQGNKIFKQGGSYEVTHLTDKEIKELRKQGFRVDVE